MAAKKKEAKKDVFEKAVPALMVLTVALAFFVGILWQKVNYLESGRVATGGGAPDAANAGAPAPVRSMEDYMSLAVDVGADKSELESCVEDKKYADRVESQYQGGIEAGVTGTPGSFILNNNGEAWKVPGALPYADIAAGIEAALGNTDQAPASIAKLSETDANKIAKVSNEDHLIGNQNAQITLIEYSDYECPYCKSFHPTIKQVLSEYENDVLLVYRHFPLDMIHPNARGIAEMSECVTELAGDEAFWEFTDAVFSS